MAASARAIAPASLSFGSAGGAKHVGERVVDAFDHLDLAGHRGPGLGGHAGELAHFGGHHPERPACFAGPRGLDRRIEGEEADLQRDVLHGLGHFLEVLRVALDLAQHRVLRSLEVLERPGDAAQVRVAAIDRSEHAAAFAGELATPRPCEAATALVILRTVPPKSWVRATTASSPARRDV